MKYLAAYCLAALGGKNDVSAADIKKILSEVGSETNDADINRVIDALRGKQLHEVINDGLKKVGSLSLGGSGGSAPAQGQAQAPKKEEKKVEVPKKEEKKPEPEEDIDLGGGLFGDF